MFHGKIEWFLREAQAISYFLIFSHVMVIFRKHDPFFHGKSQPFQVGFVTAGIYIGQLAVSLQVIVVIQRMDIQWRDIRWQLVFGSS